MTLFNLSAAAAKVQGLEKQGAGQGGVNRGLLAEKVGMAPSATASATTAAQKGQVAVVSQTPSDQFTALLSQASMTFGNGADPASSLASSMLRGQEKGNRFDLRPVESRPAESRPQESRSRDDSRRTAETGRREDAPRRAEADRGNGETRRSSDSERSTSETTSSTAGASQGAAQASATSAQAQAQVMAATLGLDPALIQELGLVGMAGGEGIDPALLAALSAQAGHASATAPGALQTGMAQATAQDAVVVQQAGPAQSGPTLPMQQAEAVTPQHQAAQATTAQGQSGESLAQTTQGQQATAAQTQASVQTPQTQAQAEGIAQAMGDTAGRAKVTVQVQGPQAQAQTPQAQAQATQAMAQQGRAEAGETRWATPGWSGEGNGVQQTASATAGTVAGQPSLGQKVAAAAAQSKENGGPGKGDGRSTAQTATAQAATARGGVSTAAPAQQASGQPQAQQPGGFQAALANGSGAASSAATPAPTPASFGGEPVSSGQQAGQSSQGTSQASQSQQTPEQQQRASAARQQVVDQIRVKISQGAGRSAQDTIKIQLKPADLGRVEVQLAIQDGRVTAQVIADTRETYDILRNDSRGLERALTEAGLKTDSDSLNFSLRDDQAQFANGGHGQGRAPSTPYDEVAHPADGDFPPEPGEIEAMRAAQAAERGGVDIRI